MEVPIYRTIPVDEWVERIRKEIVSLGGVYTPEEEAQTRANLKLCPMTVHVCPICGLDLDTGTPCYVQDWECPNKHYREVAYHYGFEALVNGKCFAFDDCGYEDPEAELTEEIERVKKEWDDGRRNSVCEQRP